MTQCGVGEMKRFLEKLTDVRDSDIFGRIEWFAVKVGATVVFLVFVGMEVFHAITKLVGR